MILRTSDAFNNSHVPGTAKLISSKEVESPLIFDRLDRTMPPQKIIQVFSRPKTSVDEVKAASQKNV